MGDLFGQYNGVASTEKNKKLDSLAAYEEHYMKLLRNYKDEIFAIEEMRRQIREERIEFFEEIFPKIRKAMEGNGVLSNEVKKEWLSELWGSMEKSFSVSEEMIAHYTTSNLEEFKRKMNEAIERV